MFRVLGHVRVEVDGAPIDLGGVKPRTILGLLLGQPDGVVSSDRITEVLWRDDAAGRSPVTLQVHVSNLRKALRPAATALGLGSVVATQSPGYRFAPDPQTVDAVQFERAIEQARNHRRRHEFDAARELYGEALALWRGAPFEDLRDIEELTGLVQHLEALRTAARTEKLEMALAVGEHQEVLHELDVAIVDHPLDERLREFRMLALYRSGKQAAALRDFRDARELLIDELGIEPSKALKDLERRILEQDPTLLLNAARGRDDAATTILHSDTTTRELIVGTRRFPLNIGIITIGRRSDQAIALDDDQVSRQHAQLQITAGGVTLTDLSSTNHTFVNGTAIVSQQLVHGDTIKIGETELRYVDLG